MIKCRVCDIALPDGTARCPMCHRHLALAVRFLPAAAILCFAVLLFGFIWYSARLKNRVDRREIAAQDILAATQALVAGNPAVHDAIGFSGLNQTTVERWGNRRWRVSGYVDTRPQSGVKARTLYFAVVQQYGGRWSLEDLQLQNMELSAPAGRKD